MTKTNMLNALAATFIPKLNLVKTQQKNVWRNVTFFVVWIILTNLDAKYKKKPGISPSTTKLRIRNVCFK